MGRFAEALQSIAATLWVGAMWGIGYIVAPLLFSRLGDRALAGLIAGKLFSLIAWVGIACAIYLLLFRMVRFGGGVFKQGVFWIVLLMLALVCAGEFGVQPDHGSAEGRGAVPNRSWNPCCATGFPHGTVYRACFIIIQSLLGAGLVVLLGRSK